MSLSSHCHRVSAIYLLAWMSALSATTVLAQSGQRAWNFDHDPIGRMPANFASALTGTGTTGRWEVMTDESAPSPPNVLAQTSTDRTDYRFPLAIAEDTSYKDLALSVRFKAISGKVDQGAGLVFRLKDKDNYYIMRANALEDNFRLYHVVKGRRVQFAGTKFKVTSNTWHQIKVEARGNEFKCFYDGQLKFAAKDDTFKEAGKIGLWTKADSVIHFDDLTVEESGSAKNSASQDKIVAQKLVEDFAARVGKKSDPEDIKAMQTGRAVVLKEEGNFDVTLPLHTASGKVIGAIGLTFKPHGTERESSAAERARKMAAELEKQITSETKLFESAG